MNYLDKINIYIPEYIGTILDKDANMFELLKSDGQSINRNRFLSMLLLGYHDAYVMECQMSYEAILGELQKYEIDSDTGHKLANRITQKVIHPIVPTKKGKSSVRLSLKPTKDTEGLISYILQEQGQDDSISHYFGRMLLSYCKKPFSERERLVFKDNYERLDDACKKARTITFTTIWNPESVHTVIPYKLAVGHEEMFNYLLCAEKNCISGKQEAKSYRLNRIAKINFRPERNTIDKDVQIHLEKMLQYGPQYSINDDDESCVKLNDSGRKNFRRIYYGRPDVDRIEDKPDGYYYYFKGSKDQVFLYFRRFGNEDAEVLFPQSLRQRMIDFHKRAYEYYESPIVTDKEGKSE